MSRHRGLIQDTQLIITFLDSKMISASESESPSLSAGSSGPRHVTWLADMLTHFRTMAQRRTDTIDVGWNVMGPFLHSGADRTSLYGSRHKHKHSDYSQTDRISSSHRICRLNFDHVTSYDYVSEKHKIPVLSLCHMLQISLSGLDISHRTWTQVENLMMKSKEICNSSVNLTHIFTWTLTFWIEMTWHPYKAQRWKIML